MYVEATGVDLDAKKLFYMLDLDLGKNIDGKVNVKVMKKFKSCFLNADMEMVGKFYQYPIKMFGNVKFKNRKQFNYSFNIDTKISSNIDVVGKYNNGIWNLHYNVKKLDLEKLDLVYPFKGKVNFRGSYNSANKILKFTNNQIEGLYGDIVEFGFNLSSKKFFHYIGLKELFKANMSGTVRIMS